MRALLWKEYREKRIWLALLATSTVVVVLGDIGYTFLGAGGVEDRLGVLSGWTYLSLVTALLLGAGSFSGELDKAAEFLLTRPVSWTKMLAAKVLVGGGIIILTALITALVFVMVVPEQYSHLATFGGVMAGVGMAVLVMGLGYCIGLICSAALPGTAGGLLVFLQVYLLMVVEILLWQAAHQASHQSVAPPAWSVLFGWPLGTLIAMVVNARFGLTLPLHRRLVRYACIPAAMGLLFLSLDIAQVRPFGIYARWQAGRARHVASIGPGARYALVPSADGYMHIASLVGGEAHPLRNGRMPIRSQSGPMGLSYQGFGWADANTVYSLDKVHADSGEPENVLTVSSIGKRGRLTERTIRMFSTGVIPVVLLPSPSGRYVAAVPAGNVVANSPMFPADTEHTRTIPTAPNWAATTVGHQGVDVVDIRSAKVIMRRQVNASDYWWQSEHEIGYLDWQGARRVLSLPR